METMRVKSKGIPLYVLESSDDDNGDGEDDKTDGVVFVKEVHSDIVLIERPNMQDSDTSSRTSKNNDRSVAFKVGRSKRSLRPKSVPETSKTEVIPAKVKKTSKTRSASAQESTPGTSGVDQPDLEIVAIQRCDSRGAAQPGPNGNHQLKPSQQESKTKKSSGKKHLRKTKHICMDDEFQQLAVEEDADPEVQVIQPQPVSNESRLPKPSERNPEANQAKAKPTGIVCPFYGCSCTTEPENLNTMKLHLEVADHSKLATSSLSSLAYKGEHLNDGDDVSYICSHCSDMFNMSAEVNEHLFCSDHQSAAVLKVICFGCPTCFLLYPTFTQCLRHMVDKNHNRHSFPLKGDNEATILPLPLTKGSFNKVMWIIRGKGGFGTIVCLTCAETFAMDQRGTYSDHLDRCQASFVYIPQSGMLGILEALVNQPWICDMCGCMLSKRKRSSHVEVCNGGKSKVPLVQQFKTIRELLLYHDKSPIGKKWIDDEPNQRDRVRKRKRNAENEETGARAQETSKQFKSDQVQESFQISQSEQPQNTRHRMLHGKQRNNLRGWQRNRQNLTSHVYARQIYPSIGQMNKAYGFPQTAINSANVNMGPHNNLTDMTNDMLSKQGIFNSVFPQAYPGTNAQNPGGLRAAHGAGSGYNFHANVGKRSKINFSQQPAGVFQFSGENASQQHHKCVTRSSNQAVMSRGGRTRTEALPGPSRDSRACDGNNNYGGTFAGKKSSSETLCTANGMVKAFKRPKESPSTSGCPEPSQEYLKTMAQIILVDLDNWPGFFVKLPASLPDKTFVWGFHAEKTNWHAPRHSCDAYRKLLEKGCFRLHPQSGNTKDAADFALCMQVRSCSNEVTR
ncbi:uncharacterized protein [Ptychodera flava]|uniref:uncharacterized protein isoform X2 n=1 Tax=Ptychodera flava TaxID=63121 RepID=UPI00396A2BB1